MKIALIHNLPSGGALRSVDGWVRWLAARHRIDLFTLEGAERPEGWNVLDGLGATTALPAPAARYRGRPFGLANPLVHRRWLGALDRTYHELARRIEAGGYQLAFAHHCRLVQAPAVLRHLALPSVYYCQEPSRRLYEPQANGASRSGRAAWIDRAIARVEERHDRLAFAAAGHVLVNSHYTREAVWRIYGRLATVLPPGVDTDHFRPDPGAARRNLALSVGAISPLKGYDFLIESLARIPAARRPELVVAGDRGDAHEAERLQALARQRGVAFEIHPPLGPHDPALVRLYNAASLFLYAPRMEPLGLAPLEAMACGTPVVGVREAGVRETVADGVSGLLAEREPAAFAAAIEALLADEARRAALGAQARELVLERWSWAVLGPRLEQFLQAVADG